MTDFVFKNKTRLLLFRFLNLNFFYDIINKLINYFVKKKYGYFILALSAWSLISVLYLVKVYKYRIIIAESNYNFFVLLFCLSVFLSLFILCIVVLYVFFKIKYLDEKKSLESKDEKLIQAENLNMNTYKPSLSSIIDSNVNSFCRIVLKELISYFGGGAGIFYLKENEKFSLITSYAVRKENVVPLFNEDDGIIGQAIKDKRVLLLNNIEKKYLTIKSGTGSINPTSIIIIPFVSDDIVYGVAEIALIKEVNENQISEVSFFINETTKHLKNIISNK